MQESNIIFLDGGCGMELKKRKERGYDVVCIPTLFSSAALLYSPNAIKQLHCDYIKSGANVITKFDLDLKKVYF